MPGIQKIQDEQLIKLIASDDNWAGALYDNYAADMYGMIYRIVGNEAIAEDVLQESFERIRENIRHYDALRGKLFIWMINICRSIALNRQTMNGTAHAEENVSSGSIQGKLEKDYRVLIDLLFIKGYSQIEVAEELNIPLGTVRSRSRAAIQKLRTLIQSDVKSEWTLKST